ncbi:unnamed protein product [Toxocara canis]|uniref:Cilia- and flagella-associated protein 299 n=1 Tax=Toxocara canis TaxID=6265 RepID=A0A183VH25_TOXCA|nr:unnamed protein product [Toxocara canis]
MRQRFSCERIYCRLISYCGLKEEEFLYDGLKLNDSELKAVEELNKNRQASVVESFVDFQKQIRFKMIVLSHLAEKLAASTPESSQDDRKRVMEKPTITPARKSYASPLDFDRILESYAFDVASKIADRSKKRKITGIPFSIHLLDRDEE